MSIYLKSWIISAFVILGLICPASAELILMKRNTGGSGYYPIVSQTYLQEDESERAKIKSIFKDILSVYQWPMITTHFFELTEDVKEAYVAALQQDHGVTLFIQNTLNKKYGDGAYRVHFVPTTIFELAGICSFMDDIITSQALPINGSIFPENDIRNGNFVTNKFKDQFAGNILKSLRENQGMPNADILAMKNACEVYNQSEATFDLFLQTTSFLFNNFNQDMLQDAEENKGIWEKIIGNLIQWHDKHDSLFDRNLEIKDQGLWGDRYNGKIYYNLKNMKYIFANMNLFLKVTKLDYESERKNNFMLFRGTGGFDVGGKSIIDSPYRESEEDYAEALKDWPESLRNVFLSIKVSTKPTNQKNTFRSFTLSYANSLMAGTFYEAASSGGARAYDYMRHGYGYALVFPMAEFFKDIGKPSLREKYYIPALHPLIALFGKGEYFHSRSKISLFHPTKNLGSYSGFQTTTTLEKAIPELDRAIHAGFIVTPGVDWPLLHSSISQDIAANSLWINQPYGGSEWIETQRNFAQFSSMEVAGFRDHFMKFRPVREEILKGTKLKPLAERKVHQVESIEGNIKPLFSGQKKLLANPKDIRDKNDLDKMNDQAYYVYKELTQKFNLLINKIQQLNTDIISKNVDIIESEFISNLLRNFKNYENLNSQINGILHEVEPIIQNGSMNIEDARSVGKKFSDLFQIKQPLEDYIKYLDIYFKNHLTEEKQIADLRSNFPDAGGASTYQWIFLDLDNTLTKGTYSIHPTEEGLIETLKELMQQGYKVLALTNRHYWENMDNDHKNYSHKDTFKLLETLGFKFSNPGQLPAFNLNEGDVNIKDQPNFKDGIIFCADSRNGKGWCLQRYLEKLAQKKGEFPGFVHFYDDDHQKVEQVLLSLGKMHIPGVGYWYTPDRALPYKLTPVREEINKDTQLLASDRKMQRLEIPPTYPVERVYLPNVFTEIIKDPANKNTIPIIDSDHSLSFNDLRKRTKEHSLIIPKGKYISFSHFIDFANPIEIVDLMHTIVKTANKLGMSGTGYRIITNNSLTPGSVSGNNANQEVPHFHIHLAGGECLGTPVVGQGKNMQITPHPFGEDWTSEQLYEYARAHKIGERQITTQTGETRRLLAYRIQDEDSGVSKLFGFLMLDQRRKSVYPSIHTFAANASAEEMRGLFKFINDVTRQAGLDKSGFRLMANFGNDASQYPRNVMNMIVAGGNPLGITVANMYGNNKVWEGDVGPLDYKDLMAYPHEHCASNAFDTYQTLTKLKMDIPPQYKKLAEDKILNLSWYKGDIGEAFKNVPDPKTVTSLDLSHCNLVELPGILQNFTEVEELKLEGNNLESLPDWIDKFGNLKWLNLTHNKLNALPTEIGKLSMLERLDLGSNNLESLPDSLKNLIKLKELYLFQNKFMIFPQGLQSLRDLEILDLSENELESLPAWISDLEKLKELVMNDNMLTELPENICNLINLEELELAHNKLIGLPKNIGNLKKLNKLYLNDNNIISLPESIINIEFKGTRPTLDLRKNKNLLETAENGYLGYDQLSEVYGRTFKR